jgi:hypothetical protein
MKSPFLNGLMEQVGEEVQEDEVVEDERYLVVEIELENEISKGKRLEQAELTANGY